MSMHKQTKAATCLNCGKVLDMASCAEEDNPGPQAGDLNVCFYCGHLSAYDEEGQFRELTDAEIVDVAGSPLLLRLQYLRGKVVAEMEARRKAGEKTSPDTD